MNTKVLGIVVLALVVIGAVALALSMGDTSPQTGVTGDGAMMIESEAMMENDTADVMMQADDAMMEGDDTMMQEDDSAMETSAGTYSTYSADKLAMAAQGDVVLFFKADWCPSCRALDSDIRANLSSIPAGVTILEVDYDSATELKQKYGVTTQHTLVQVDATGDLVKKWSGGNTLTAALMQII